MITSPYGARLLGANLAYSIGVDALAQRMTIEEVTEEALRLADIHHMPAYVYRLANGNLKATLLAPHEIDRRLGATMIGRYQ